MKVFISWSGERSKAVAEILDEWLQCVLQAIDPWMSSKDIDRGSLWFSELTDQLADTSIGIVCLTQDNKEKPWILFESGALAKGLTSSRVCTLLVDLEPTDVGNPLAQFNHTFPTRDGIFDLVRTLNATLGESQLNEGVLSKVFDTYWPQFETAFNLALSENQPKDAAEPRTEENILLEVLSSIRRIDRRLLQVEQRANDGDMAINHKSPPRHAMSRGQGESAIRQLIDDDVTFESIVSIMDGYGFNRNWVKNQIDKYRLSDAKSKLDG